MTTINLGRVGINWRGAYSPQTSYQKGDAVAYQGSSYLAKQASTKLVPEDSEAWDLVAAGSSSNLAHAGELLTHDGNQTTVLAAGNHRQILQMHGNLPTWQNLTGDPSEQVTSLAQVNGLGGWHTRVYLMANGMIKASGRGSTYSNGSPQTSNRFTPEYVQTDDPDVRFVAVYSGGSSHFALTADGQVWSWGANNYGELGHGDTAGRWLATKINFFADEQITVTKIITGRVSYIYYCAVYFLTDQGEVYGCGYNAKGNLGNGTTSNQYIPVRCGTLTNVAQLAVSGPPYSVFAILEDGSLSCWGDNSRGQLGLGNTTNRTSPTVNTAVTNVAQVAVGCGYHSSSSSTYVGYTLVLDRNGVIWATGNNTYGQLGLGSTTSHNSFRRLTYSEIFTDIAVGDGYECNSAAISDNNDLYVWGFNDDGQIGDGTTDKRTTPYKPSGSFQGQVTRVVVGGTANFHGYLVQAGDQLWAAGYSGNGNLGTGNFNENNKSFARVLGENFSIVDWNCYGARTGKWGLGVVNNYGQVFVCGYNKDYGELGTTASSPVNLNRLTKVKF